LKDKPHRFFYGYIIVAAGFLIMTIMWGTYYSFGIFFEPVLKEFGWTRAATSGAFSLSLVLTGFFAIVMGRLNDRFGPRKVITACALLLGAGYILMSQISALWELYLFYGLILGIGLGGAFVPVASTISRWFIRRRSLMTGITASGIGVGTFLMPPIANWLISSYGWRTSYIIIGAVAAVLIIIAAQFLRRDPEKMGLKPYGENEVGQENSGLRVAGFSMHEAISTRQYWICTVALFCAWFSICIIIAHIVIHAIGLEISPASAANTLAILGVGGILGRIIMGGAGDRIGNRAAIITSFVLMTLALLWLLIAKEAWMLYLFSILFGFAYGAVSTLESPMIAELFGLGSHGLIFGVIFFSDSVGGAIGVVLAGRIFDIIGSYQPAFLTCVALSLVSISLFLFLRPISKAKLED
jgi:MFS family permease